MSKRLAALFLLSLLILAFLTVTVTGADKPDKRVFFGPRYETVKVTPLSGKEPIDYSVSSKGTDKVSLGASGINGIGTADTVGYTYYEYQQNYTMGRQVEHRNTNVVHFDWMWTNNPGTAGRDCRYQAYDLNLCDVLFGTEGTPMDAGYAGYVTIDAYFDTTFGIPTAHCELGPGYTPVTYWDFGYTFFPGPLGPFEIDFPSDINGWGVPGFVGTGPDNQNIWPKIDLQVGTDMVVHMICRESTPTDEEGVPYPYVYLTMSYYRRVGGYGRDVGTWSDQRVVDSGLTGGPTLAADPNSDKVALVWPGNAAYLPDDETEFGVGWIDNDIYYAISTDQGAEWVAKPTTSEADSSIGHMVALGIFDGGNCTNYTEVYDTVWKAYGEVQALFTTDGNLHVIWQTRLRLDDASATWRDAAIWHWSQDNPNVNLVFMAPRTGVSDSALCVGLPDFSGDVAKISLAQCGDNLYTSFSRFGTNDNQCGYRDLVNVDAYNRPIAMSYLYVTASENGGVNWDKPQRVTSVPDLPEGCYPDSTCQSEYWASMARYGRTEVCGDFTGQQVLDIMYINDQAPAGAIRGGQWTNNPVVWLRTDCRDVVYEALWEDNGGPGYGEGIGDWPLRVRPDGDTTITLLAWNPGLLSSDFSAVIDYTDGDGWIDMTPLTGTVPCCLEDTTEFTLVFSPPTGAGDPSVWDAQIDITHQQGTATDPDVVRSLPVRMIVASDFTYPQGAVLATTCKRIQVFNTGELVNDSVNAAFDFIEDCDTFNPYTEERIYLYDASPIITWVDGEDTVRYMMYSKSFIDTDALRPLSELTVDETNESYSYATAEFATADSSVGFIVEYFVPKHEDSCCFMIEKLKFWNRTEIPITGALVGEFLDWDIPSDTGSRNGSGYDDTRALIYQYGGEYDQDDSTEALCAQESSDRFGGIAMGQGMEFKNATTLDNATYVYSSGPYQLEAPMPPGVTYELMKDNEGYSTWSSADPDSEYTDLSTLVTFGEYDLYPDSEHCVVKIISTTKTGLEDLQDHVDKGNAFILAHEEIQCPVTVCDCTPGNPNGDGGINVGDAVYLIAYVFKQGPAPVPYAKCSGDANGDCGVNVGDAVYLIAYVFKQGPAPVDCETWRNDCGPLQ